MAELRRDRAELECGGSFGETNSFVSGSHLRNDLGIELPDGSAAPLHEQTERSFAYVDHNLDDESRASLITGTSNQ